VEERFAGPYGSAPTFFGKAQVRQAALVCGAGVVAQIVE
jgi:hypothetical protein